MMYFICHDVFYMLWWFFYVVMYYVCHGVFFMLWCITYVMAYFLCCDVLHMSCHSAWVVTYFLCHDFACVVPDFMYPDFICIVTSLLHMLGCILSIVGCRDSWCFGPIVSGETCGWLIYEPTGTYLRRLQHITHSFIHLSAGHLMPDGLPRTSCVVLVYGRHCTRTLLCVMHWWEP